MITDAQMIELGFKKKKHHHSYFKRKEGVSIYFWEKDRFTLSIEKAFGRDFGDFFQPTLRIEHFFWRWEDIDALKLMLTALFIYDENEDKQNKEIQSTPCKLDVDGEFILINKEMTTEDIFFNSN